MVSGIVAGIIADKNEKNSLLTKSWICMAGSIVALPMIALATLQTSYFNLSMVCFSIFTFFAAAFSGSAITMLQSKWANQVGNRAIELSEILTKI